MLYFLSFHLSYPTQTCVCIPDPDIIDTSLSYSTIRSSTNFLKLSKWNFPTQMLLSILLFQSCNESQNTLNYYIMSLTATKFIKHE